jgi:hypothetical protein
VKGAEQVVQRPSAILLRQSNRKRRHSALVYMSPAQFEHSLEVCANQVSTKRGELLAGLWLLSQYLSVSACAPPGEETTIGQRVLRSIGYHVQFGPQCQLCPRFGPGLCTDKPNGRHLGINAHHDVIQARRLEADTEAFRQEMHIRAGIEGTVSEMVRGHGLRRSRFRGTQKNQMQALFGAAATIHYRTPMQLDFGVKYDIM